MKTKRTKRGLLVHPAGRHGACTNCGNHGRPPKRYSRNRSGVEVILYGTFCRPRCAEAYSALGGSS